MEKTFTLYWRTGKRQFVTGPDIAEACLLAGFSNDAINALGWYDDRVSDTHIFIKPAGESGRWVKRGPINMHRDDVASQSVDEFTRILKTSSEIRIELRNKDRIVIRQRYGQFAMLGWVKYIEVFYGEKVDLDHEDEVAFNVHTPVYFDPDDFANAVDCLKTRVAAAVDNSTNAINVGHVNDGAKSLDEIKTSQKTIPL